VFCDQDNVFIILILAKVLQNVSTIKKVLIFIWHKVSINDNLILILFNFSLSFSGITNKEIY
jgi:hypothetical protein